MKSPLNKLLCLILFDFIFRSDFTYAQNYNPLQWITITKEDGLAGNVVLSMLEDRQGNLWFGTDEGVSRYDGKKFTTFTAVDGFAGNDIHAIVEDRQGNLWFGTWGNGVSRYDGKTFTFFTAAEGLAGNGVRSIVADRQGNLWFGTWDGVSRYDGKTFTTFTTADGLAGNNINAIVEDRQGNLWFGTWGSGVSRYDGKTFTTFTTAHGLAGNDIQAILEDRQGNLWFGIGGIFFTSTKNGIELRMGSGVSRYDGKSFTTFTAADGLAGNVVQTMMKDRQGNLWFSTFGGISRYDGKMFTNLIATEGLAANVVWTMAEDRQGNLWFGTSDGISRYDSKTFTTFTTADGLAANFVSAMAEDRQGNLWFSTQVLISTNFYGFNTGKGVSRYDGKTFTTFTAADGLAHNLVQTIAEDRQGNLWFGTADGVSRYDSKTFTTFTAAKGLAGNDIRPIVVDRQGNLWFGTNDGVSRYDGKTFTTFTAADGLAGNLVNATMADCQGNLWFGTWGSGVSRYDGKTFTTFTTADGLAHNLVQTVAEDRQGNLWFGTADGLSRYDGKTFTTFTTADGLAGYDVRSIVVDLQGNLWFGTWWSGVSRYDGKTFTNFTIAHGLAGNNVKAMLADRQGNLWFGTDNGVSKCHFTEKTPAIANVKEISIGLFFILVQFDGFSYNASADELKFASRFDNEPWSKPQKRKWLLKSYLLGAGEHTFRIRAYDQYKNFPPIIEKAFTITKIQWLQNIFLYCLILLSVIFFASLKVRKKVKQRNALKRKLNPYIAGPPIVDSKMFYGREELIQAIINAVSQNNIAIRAERRMGKTSILHQLEQRLTKPLLPVHINIQGIKEQEFFSRLMKRTIRRCKKYFKNDIDLTFTKNSRQYDDIDFICDLDTITTHLKETFHNDVILVLLIDEIDELVGYDIQISKRFRAIFTEGKLPVRTVVAGTFFDQQKWDDKTSPWYNFFVIHRLESLTEPEARALITKPSKGIYSFDKDAIERILILSDKQPYLIQTICHYAINKILAEKRRKVTAADVEAVYHSYIEGKEEP